MSTGARNFALFFLRSRLYKEDIIIFFFLQMKRGCSASSDRLTGGTQDVNPQVMLVVGQDTIPAGTTGSLGFRHQFSNPAWEFNRAIQPACDTSKQIAYVLEILRVDLLADSLPFESTMGVGPQVENLISLVSTMNAAVPPLAAGSGYMQTLEWITQSTRDSPLYSANTYCVGNKHTNAATTPTGSPLQSQDDWLHFDLTDGDGHGVIVNNNVLTVLRVCRITATTGPSANSDSYYGVRILYRYKGISYADWVRQFAFGM